MEPESLQGRLRSKILEMNFKAKSGHIGSALSCLDIMLSVLPDRAEGDTFILSKGHATSALYAVLNALGEIPDEVIDSFYKNGSVLTGHPAPLKFPSIPFATGSLGHGFPIGNGIALADKIKGSTAMTCVLMSDGETNEGTTWEAAHFAVANKLDNLLVIIDKNRWQGFGSIGEVLGDTAAPQLWAALGFEVNEVDGHDIAAIRTLKNELRQRKNGIPKVLIANTVKGKGVDFMEDTLDWHYLSMNDGHYEKAVASVQTNYKSSQP